MSAELEKILSIKVFNDIKNAMNKLENIIEKKRNFIKLRIFSELKTKFFFLSQFKSNKMNSANQNKDSAFDKHCEKCKCKLNENEEKYLLLKHSSNKNLCAKCNINIINSNSDQSINLNKLGVENIIIIAHEKKLFLSKLKNLLKSIFNNDSNKQMIYKAKYFTRWSNAAKFTKYYSNLKNEYEKKYASKFEAKIQENNKLIKKLDKEKIEITIKNESLLQSIEVKTLKINTFKDKEKSLSAKLKALANEKKKVLSDLQKNEADIDSKISNLENFVRELEIKIKKLKEAKIEKNSLLNKYIDEMNDVLDYYEKKTSK